MLSRVGALGCSARLSLSGSQSSGFSVGELRSSSLVPHLCRDTQVLVWHPAGHKMPSTEEGQTAIASTIQLQEDPDLADCVVSNSFPTNRASSLLPGHLPCVDDSGKWSGISMSSLYWFPFTLICTAFSLCREKFLTKGKACSELASY